MPDKNAREECQIECQRRMPDKKVRKNVRQVCYVLHANSCVCGSVVEWLGQCHFLLCRWQSLKQNMFDRRCADMFGHVCLFGSGGPLACLVMFKQTCWELWSLLHMAHWHVYILFDRLTCTMTCQVKQMIGVVGWAKVPWQKLQTKIVSTSCFEMSWWGSLEVKYFFGFALPFLAIIKISQAMNNVDFVSWFATLPGLNLMPSSQSYL